MPQHSRAANRRQQRRSSSAPLVAGIVLVVLIVAVAILVVLPRWRRSGASAKPVNAPVAVQPAPVKPKRVTSATTRSADASAATSPNETPVVADAATLSAAAASEKATQRAAVPFPGAPSISPTTRSVNQLHPRHKYVAITLDDGYGFQPDLLKLLQQYDAHCTTFLVGSWAAANKSDLRAMKAAGFEIANHSWTHPMLTKLSSAQIASQLTKTQTVISSVTGNQAPYLRPPFGATDPHVKAVAASLGYRIVMWDRTFGDSGRGATVDKLYDNVVNSHGGIQPGDVILCHWGSKPSYEALKRILPDLKAQGYEFVTISELIADSTPSK